MSIVKPCNRNPSFCSRYSRSAIADAIRQNRYCSSRRQRDTLFYLVDGSVAIIIEDEEGKEIILTYLNKGEFIGEMGLFTSQIQPSRSVLVRTRSSCMLAEISYARLEQLFETDLKPYLKEMLYAMGAQLTQRLLHQP